MDRFGRIGKVALVHYCGGASGENPVDDCSTGEPERVVLGVGELPRGMDEAFLDMEVGETRTVVIPCERGFGEHDPNGVQTYSRTFAEGFENLRVGDVVFWTNPVSGRRIPVRVVEADDRMVTLDYNHPLAGKELTYQLELVGMAGD